MTLTHQVPDPTLEGVWAVVVNWRQADATLACLDSLVRAGIDPRAIVVIDNGSGDDLAVRVPVTHPQAAFLPQSQNLGFARAVNLGARYAIDRGATAVLLLNNDAVIRPGAIAEMARRLRRSRRLGVVTAKVFLTDHPGHLWAVGGRFTGRRVVEIGAGERDVGAYDAVQLDFAYGCALLLRAELFRELGGFDERFFLYYEDIDLCLRARAAGWEIAMAADAHVLHEGSRSTRDEPEAKVYHHARSRLLFFDRHVRGMKRTLFAVTEAAYITRRLGGYAIAGEWRNVKAYIRGTVDALRRRDVIPEPPGASLGVGHAADKAATP